MNGGQHLVIGAATTGLGLWFAHSVLGVHIESSTTMAALGVASIGSLAPDLDHPRATISRGIPRQLLKSGCAFLPFILVAVILPLVSSVLSGGDAFETARKLYNTPLIQLVLVIAGGISLIAVVLLGTSVVVSSLFGHRGATHSLIVALWATGLGIVVSVFAGIAWWYGLIFGWGYVTHLLADATTEMGLPELFWPISKGW